MVIFKNGGGGVGAREGDFVWIMSINAALSNIESNLSRANVVSELM